MKKTLITIGIVLAFTLLFVFVFRFTGGAEELLAVDTTENESVMDSEAVIVGNGAPSSEEVVGDGASTSRVEEDFDLKAYIKEKIVPVVVGVLTSSSALLATLMAIRKSLASIGDTKDTFKKEARRREEKFREESEHLREKTEEIEKMVALVPELEKRVTELDKNMQALISECASLGKMISLGFSQDERVVTSGNGKKISKLLQNCELMSKSIKNLDEAVSSVSEARV
ncbi:MAG: hypothetical protein E7602_04960 [Ruminococcaceae bacterium]|nr:hypothetical protein [Oscillospiraceae bacterium]